MRGESLEPEQEPARLSDLRTLDAYFHRNVLAQLAPALQQEACLLALLPDMPTPLLERVATESARQWLQSLADAVFFVRKDQRDGVVLYRLHNLLQDFLQRQAQTAADAAQRRAFLESAADWRLQRKQPEEALELLIRAGSWPRVSQVLRENWIALMQRSRHYAIQHCIDRIPAEFLAKDPWLLLVQGANYFFTNMLLSLPPLEAALALFREQGDEPGELFTLGQLVNVFMMVEGCFRQRRDLMRRANHLLEKHQNPMDPASLLTTGHSIIAGNCYFVSYSPRVYELVRLVQQRAAAAGLVRTNYETIIPTLVLAEMLHGHMPHSYDLLEERFDEQNDPAKCQMTRFSNNFIRFNLYEMAGDYINYREQRWYMFAAFTDIMEQSMLGAFSNIWDMDMLLAEPTNT